MMRMVREGFCAPHEIVTTIVYMYLFSPKVVKKLPGIRKYVDPQNYSSPDAALKDFALEIPSHQLRLDEVIGGGEFYI